MSAPPFMQAHARGSGVNLTRAAPLAMCTQGKAVRRGSLFSSCKVPLRRTVAITCSTRQKHEVQLAISRPGPKWHAKHLW